MRTWFRSYVMAFLASVLLLVTVSSPANAYVSANLRQLSTTPKYNWGPSITSTWKTYFQTGFSNWNSAQSKLTWSFGSGGGNYADTFYDLNTSYFGSTYGSSAPYQVRDPQNVWSTCYITINTYALDLKSTNFKVSVATHEIGHAMGLDENNFSGGTAIMDQGRNRDALYTPRTDDVNGINYLYRP